MAWIMHSSGPWKDHKYKERSGSPGKYTYKYTETEHTETEHTETEHTEKGTKNYDSKFMDPSWGGYKAHVRDNIELDRRTGFNGAAAPMTRGEHYRDSRTDEIGQKGTYWIKNPDLTRAVGGDSKRNEIKGKQAKEAQKRKDFEKMTLTSMRNALNSAKENKKKSDADMRDAAVARGREQYMTNRAKKTVGAMTKAIEKKREEEKRKAYEHSRLKRIMGR